jgi:hypothetical protein
MGRMTGAVGRAVAVLARADLRAQSIVSYASEWGGTKTLKRSSYVRRQIGHSGTER